MGRSDVSSEMASLAKRCAALGACKVAAALVNGPDVPEEAAALREAPGALGAHMVTLATMYPSHVLPEIAQSPEQRGAFAAGAPRARWTCARVGSTASSSARRTRRTRTTSRRGSSRGAGGGGRLPKGLAPPLPHPQPHRTLPWHLRLLHLPRGARQERLRGTRPPRLPHHVDTHEASAWTSALQVLCKCFASVLRARGWREARRLRLRRRLRGRWRRGWLRRQSFWRRLRGRACGDEGRRARRR